VPNSWSLIGYSLISRQDTYLIVIDIQFSHEMGLKDLVLVVHLITGTLLRDTSTFAPRRVALIGNLELSKWQCRGECTASSILRSSELSHKNTAESDRGGMGHTIPQRLPYPTHPPMLQFCLQLASHLEMDLSDHKS
jgi:hypothetical protein